MFDSGASALYGRVMANDTTMIRGSRRWLQYADPATWQLGTDRALGLQVLAAHAHRAGRRFAVDSLVRTVYECSACTARVEANDECCDGAEIVPYEVAAPKVALGLLDGSRRSLARMGLVAA